MAKKKKSAAKKNNTMLFIIIGAVGGGGLLVAICLGSVAVFLLSGKDTSKPAPIAKKGALLPKVIEEEAKPKGADNPNVSRAHYNQIRDDMKMEDVLAILGPATSTFGNGGDQSMTWATGTGAVQDGRRTIRISFRNGHVSTKSYLSAVD